MASFTSIGLQPVVLSDVDIVPSLRTGMVEVFPSTPMTALALQTYPSTPHMIDVPIAFMLAAVVVERTAWLRIPEAQRLRILARARRIGLDMTVHARSGNVEALGILQAHGVHVHRPTGQQRAAWNTAGARALGLARGRSVDTSLVDEVLRQRDAYRASRARRP
jgi:TRAP-type C4-dicarboxylate transport system substrate-binding protein